MTLTIRVRLISSICVVVGISWIWAAHYILVTSPHHWPQCTALPTTPRLFVHLLQDQCYSVQNLKWGQMLCYMSTLHLHAKKIPSAHAVNKIGEIPMEKSMLWNHFTHCLHYLLNPPGVHDVTAFTWLKTLLKRGNIMSRFTVHQVTGWQGNSIEKCESTGLFMTMIALETLMWYKVLKRGNIISRITVHQVTRQFSWKMWEHWTIHDYDSLRDSDVI